MVETTAPTKESRQRQCSWRSWRRSTAILALSLVIFLVGDSSVAEYLRISISSSQSICMQSKGLNLRQHANETFVPRPRIITLYPALASKTTNHIVRSVLPIGMNITSTIAEEVHVTDFKRPFYEECELYDEWQTRSYSTCNSLHEIDMEASDANSAHASILSDGGYSRLVWKVRLGNETLVLKTLRFDREFNETTYPFSTLDAIVMERLTSSPFHINSYGFCGQSLVTEFAPQPAAILIKSEGFNVRQHGIFLARDLALGMHDMHYIGNTTEATFSHNDVNRANIVSTSDGFIKYNDYNLGVMLRRNATSKKSCGYPFPYSDPLWRSPEEVMQESYVSEKVDVFALGHIYFLILTTHDPWNHLEPGGQPCREQMRQNKIEGVLPFLPGEYANTTIIEERAIITAYKACYQHDPQNRPSALRLSQAFDKVIAWSKKKRKASEKELRKLFHLVE